MSSSQLALITGASSGIGATYAQRLAARGYNLILVARDVARLEALAQTLRDSAGVEVSVLPADLTKAQDVQRIEQELRDNPNITLLLNNAGMSVEGEFVDANIDRIQTMLTLNIVTPTQLAHTAAQVFRARGNGTIVNIASVLALMHERFNGAYDATKSFVLTLTRAMQRELVDSGVRVQAVLPGATRTEIFDRSGTPLSQIPAEMLMEVGDLVDAALSGLDAGEQVTIPALEHIDLWHDFDNARVALQPYLSVNKPASRYQKA